MSEPTPPRPDFSWALLLVIAVGGALGSLARWGLTVAWPSVPPEFPWSTFSANVGGSFFLGVLMGIVLRSTHRYLRPFVGVGILGGFTTFSTYALDTRTLLAQSLPALAAAYVLATLVFGLLAAFAGLTVTRMLVGHARSTEEMV